METIIWSLSQSLFFKRRQIGRILCNNDPKYYLMPWEKHQQISFFEGIMHWFPFGCTACSSVGAFASKFKFISVQTWLFLLKTMHWLNELLQCLLWLEWSRQKNITRKENTCWGHSRSSTKHANAIKQSTAYLASPRAPNLRGKIPVIAMNDP